MKDTDEGRTVNTKALIDQLVGDLLDLAELEGREVPNREQVERAIGRHSDK